MQKKNFPPLIKKLLHIRDCLVLNRGSVLCLKFNASLAYDFFKPTGHVTPWEKIVWNRALPPKFSFFFWLVLCLATTLYYLWKCRNKVIFELYIPDTRCLSLGWGCN
ncbi:hypothetical protein M9H77_36132 [Catharanthus roseus]|uniref:Uncharacterized protein n=1 Tax=Catharanthus roseus TaxID=4058 RepID=A0ACB9ZT51_CATRO|nr:hypothetical protein M9H77_36132 [Catharanthus roseus]